MSLSCIVGNVGAKFFGKVPVTPLDLNQYSGILLPFYNWGYTWITPVLPTMQLTVGIIRVHAASTRDFILGRVSALSPVSFHLSSVLCPVFSSALSTVFSSRSLFAHLSSLERSASEFVPPHLRLINSHQLPIISHQEARLDPTRSRRDRGGSVGRGGGGEERETHPEVKVFSFSVRFGDCFLASCRTQSAVHSLKRCHRLSACLNIKQRVLLGLSSTQQPSYSQLRSTHSQRIQHRADIRW